jgi:hypothetical protein
MLDCNLGSFDLGGEVSSCTLSIEVDCCTY